jgi:hypothetical protein
MHADFVGLQQLALAAGQTVHAQGTPLKDNLAPIWFGEALLAKDERPIL